MNKRQAVEELRTTEEALSKLAKARAEVQTRLAEAEAAYKRPVQEYSAEELVDQLTVNRNEEVLSSLYRADRELERRYHELAPKMQLARYRSWPYLDKNPDLLIQQAKAAGVVVGKVNELMVALKVYQQSEKAIADRRPSNGWGGGAAPAYVTDELRVDMLQRFLKHYEDVCEYANESLGDVPGLAGFLTGALKK